MSGENQEVREKLKLWHIGDSHGYHNLLTVPEGIDIVIHSGDFSNYWDEWKNEPEARDFIRWFGNLKIEHKILIAGNHDAFAAKSPQEFRNLCTAFGITYLENDFTYVEDLKIWGSPHTPTFGNWHFMKSKSNMDNVWKEIPEDTDILVTHGPPKGILDLVHRASDTRESCGCSALKKHILNRVQPKLCLFGHIHNNGSILNAGVMKLACSTTIFSNGSIVTDGKFGTLTSNGNLFEV